MPAKTVDSKPGLALFINKTLENKVYMLYDAQGFKENLLSKKHSSPKNDWYSELESSFYDSILAFIQVEDPETPSWNAKEVKYSAAEKGYGPLLYDIVMADTGKLVPDRNTVSADAEKIWNKYMNRSDVEHQPLDDIEKPQTRSETDDSELHVPMRSRTKQMQKLDSNIPIDHAFSLKTAGPNTANLLKNHETSVEMVLGNTRLSRGDFYSLIDNLANRFFNERFDNIYQ